MAETVIQPLFSRPLGITSIDEVPNVSEIQGGFFQNANWINGNIGDYSADLKILSRFPKTYKAIYNKVKEFNDEVMNYKDNDIQIVNSWVTRFKPGYKGNLHNHANCMNSAVLYLDEGSDLTFVDYNQWMYDVRAKNYNQFNTKSFTISPERGKLLIFPGFVSHVVETNKTDKTRYSIVANYTIRGPIGINDTEWYIDGHAT